LIGYPLNFHGYNIKIVENNSSKMRKILIGLIILHLISFIIGIIIGVIWFTTTDTLEKRPIGIVFPFLGVCIPLIIRFICLKLINDNYKKNPELNIFPNWIIEGTLCPKCRVGKIKYSILNDGQSGFCGVIKKEIFVCLECNTVYPENCLSIYFGLDPPFRRRRRR
jgi:hypothetical protein